MYANERTKNIQGYSFINPSSIGNRLEQITRREMKSIVCDSKLEYCPKCQGFVRLTAFYNRTIDHLDETVKYSVAYYYCDTCKLGWPSLPADVLPNITAGIDVLGHVAKWHVLFGQSFKTLKKHLLECHGINRCERTIQTYFQRFELLCQEVFSRFDSLVQEYFENQDVKFALFDETFFSSLYNAKLCMGILFLPEIRVIAGIKIMENRNQEVIKQTMKEFHQRFGSLDVLVVDLAPIYVKPLTEVYTAISLQYCVFHFFQILFRKIVNPVALSNRQLLKDKIRSLQKKGKDLFLKIRKQTSGSYTEILQDLEKRFDWCLKKHWSSYLIIEVGSFIQELNNVINRKIQEIQNQFQFYSPIKIFICGLQEFTLLIARELNVIKKIPELQQFQEIYETIIDLRELFKCSNEEEFDKRYQILVKMINSSSNKYLQEILGYLKKYQSNLTVFLQTGVEKTTSLLEQVNQRIKKSTKNNRGAHYRTTMQSFGNLYQFFWNTEPLQLREELKHEIRSPISRLAETIMNSYTFDTSQAWWAWMQPFDYHYYRKQVSKKNELKIQEYKVIQERRNLNKSNEGLTYEKKAVKR